MLHGACSPRVLFSRKFLVFGLFLSQFQSASTTWCEGLLKRRLKVVVIKSWIMILKWHKHDVLLGHLKCHKIIVKSLMVVVKCRQCGVPCLSVLFCVHLSLESCFSYSDIGMTTSDQRVWSRSKHYRRQRADLLRNQRSCNCCWFIDLSA